MWTLSQTFCSISVYVRIRIWGSHCENILSVLPRKSMPFFLWKNKMGRKKKKEKHRGKRREKKEKKKENQQGEEKVEDSS